MLTHSTQRSLLTYLLIGALSFTFLIQTFHPVQASRNPYRIHEYSHNQAEYRELQGKDRFFFQASNLAKFESLHSRFNQAKGLANIALRILSMSGHFTKIAALAGAVSQSWIAIPIGLSLLLIQEMENTRCQLKPKVVIGSPKEMRESLSQFISESKSQIDDPEEKMNRIQNFIFEQRETNYEGSRRLNLNLNTKSLGVFGWIRQRIRDALRPENSLNQALWNDLKPVNGFKSLEKLKNFLGTEPAEKLEKEYWSMSEQRIDRIKQLWKEAQELRKIADDSSEKPTFRMRLARFFGSKQYDGAFAKESAEQKEAKAFKEVNDHAKNPSAAMHLYKGFKRLKTQVSQKGIDQICQALWDEKDIVGDLGKSRMIDLDDSIEKESNFTALVKFIFRIKKTPIFEGKDGGLSEELYKTTKEKEYWKQLGGVGAQTIACINPAKQVKYFTLANPFTRKDEIELLRKRLKNSRSFKQQDFSSLGRDQHSLMNQLPRSTSSDIGNNSDSVPPQKERSNDLTNQPGRGAIAR